MNGNEDVFEKENDVMCMVFGKKIDFPTIEVRLINNKVNERFFA